MRVSQRTSSPLLDSITSSSMAILRSPCTPFRQLSLHGKCCAGILTFELTLTDKPPGFEIEYFRVLRPPGAVKLSPTERFREFNPSSSFRPLPRKGLRELSMARRLLVKTADACQRIEQVRSDSRSRTSAYNKVEANPDVVVWDDHVLHHSMVSEAKGGRHPNFVQSTATPAASVCVERNVSMGE